MVEFLNTQQQTVGLMLTTCNDAPMAKVMYPSLMASMPSMYRWAFFVIDSGSSDDAVAYFKSKHEKIYGPHTPDFYPTFHQVDALNAGIKTYLGYDPDKNEFTKLDYIGYIGWVHADMEFPNKGWLGDLVKVAEEHPEYGKLGPDDWGRPVLEDRPGNQCPWIMPVSALMALWKKDGFFFRSGYQCVGEYADWDLNRRLINMGLKVMITSRVHVKHEGMGTRKLQKGEKFHQVNLANASLYGKTWGDYNAPC